MNLKRRNAAKIKFYAGIMVALGAKKVFATLKTDEISTDDHQNN